MKVLRIATSLGYGGIEKVFELHAKYHDKSFEIVFVALGGGGMTQNLLKELGYRVIVLEVEKVAIPSLELIQILTRLFELEKPDVVHAAGAEANFHVPIAAKLAGVKKIICEEIGIPNHSQKAKIIFRFIYKLSDKVIAISKAVEEYLITSREVPANKVCLVYNPVNETALISESCKEDLLFTVVARLEPVKNLSFLIEAFSEILKNWPDAVLNIIGDGSQKELLQEKINSLSLANKVILKGFIPNPYPELAKSTYFILPSLFEGFGLACVEAIQAGNVVICTSSGGIPEFINDEKQGFIFDPKDKHALLAAINKAVNLKMDEREEMVRSAQKRVTQMFSPSKYINELQELYFRS